MATGCLILRRRPLALRHMLSHILLFSWCFYNTENLVFCQRIPRDIPGFSVDNFDFNLGFQPVSVDKGKTQGVFTSQVFIFPQISERLWIISLTLPERF